MFCLEFCRSDLHESGAEKCWLCKDLRILWDDYGMNMGWLWDDYGMIMGWLWDDYGIIVGLIWDYYGIIWLYPLVNIQKAIENGHRQFVDLPIKNGGFFHSKTDDSPGRRSCQNLNPAWSVKRLAMGCCWPGGIDWGISYIYGIWWSDKVTIYWIIMDI